MIWLARKLALICLIITGMSLILFLSLFLYLPSLVTEEEIQVVGIPEEYKRAYSRPPFPITGNEKLTLTEETFSFPIRPGKTGPKHNNFNIPLEYPFKCGKNIYPQRQAIIDNQEKIGSPIFEVDATGLKTQVIVGYSKDCSHPTRVDYFYNRKNSRDFYPLGQADNDIAGIEIDGEKIDFIVRLETGTINRFIYAIASLKGPGESIDSGPDKAYWNQKLIYQFRGGVGIGKRQGDFKPKHIMKRRYDQLAQGYAVAYSSGNQTKNHYNLRLAEDTARRVKQQFIHIYGEPEYTVGVGGSGGAIQQYLIAQNSDDVLDAILPLSSYPDMVTQIIHILDCELLEFYMDVTDRKNKLWRLASNKEKIIGLHANNNIKAESYYMDRLGALINGSLQLRHRGSTECTVSWRALTPAINNPRFHHRSGEYTKSVRRSTHWTHWTHWDNLRFFYGTDEQGFGNSFWDNVGVQYGLAALKSGFLNPKQFLHLNKHIGGWKTQAEHEDENFWVLNGSKSFSTFSPWSHHNITHDGLPENSVAPRTKGNQQAYKAAINSGHVFLGTIAVPTIDIRQYREEELDMHHLSASFSTRARIAAAGGDIRNQPIWVSHSGFNPTNKGFAVIDRWIKNIKQHPERSLAQNRPADAIDSCFDDTGKLIASGHDAWNGDWNHRKTGVCSATYPTYKNSRMIAGADIKGYTSKCLLVPVDTALERGFYHPINMRPWRKQLEGIFPDGVCDYSAPVRHIEHVRSMQRQNSRKAG